MDQQPFPQPRSTQTAGVRHFFRVIGLCNCSGSISQSEVCGAEGREGGSQTLWHEPRIQGRPKTSLEGLTGLGLAHAQTSSFKVHF